MKPWWQYLLEFFAGAWTKDRLTRAGASPDMLQGAATTMVDLPTFSVPIAVQEAGQRSRIVAFMRSQLGKGYQLGVEISDGSEGAAKTWDCSEAVEHAYELAGLLIPDGAQQQYDACQAVPGPAAGDLGFLWSDTRGKIGHVMVATGDGTVVHAVGGRGVVEDPVDRWAHHPRWRGWRRHVDFARPPEDRA